MFFSLSHVQTENQGFFQTQRWPFRNKSENKYSHSDEPWHKYEPPLLINVSRHIRFWDRSRPSLSENKRLCGCMPFSKNIFLLSLPIQEKLHSKYLAEQCGQKNKTLKSRMRPDPNYEWWGERINETPPLWMYPTLATHPNTYWCFGPCEGEGGGVVPWVELGQLNVNQCSSPLATDTHA